MTSPGPWLWPEGCHPSPQSVPHPVEDQHGLRRTHARDRPGSVEGEVAERRRPLPAATETTRPLTCDDHRSAVVGRSRGAPTPGGPEADGGPASLSTSERGR